MPSWYMEIQNKWLAQIAHVFILHGNVGDIVGGGKYVPDVLTNSGLCIQQATVIQYDRSNGITFPLESHKKAFMEAIEIDDSELELMPAEPVRALRLIEKVLKLTKPASEFDNTAKKLGLEDPWHVFQVLQAHIEDTSAANALNIKAKEVQELRTLAARRVPFASLIVSYAETICPNNDISSMSPDDRTVLVTLQRWARDINMQSAGSPVFLITENLTDLHAALRCASSRIEAVHIPYPGTEERRNYIARYANARGVKVEDIDRTAALTAGLKKVHTEDIILRAKLEGKDVTPELIKTRKEEIVRTEFADVLELLDPEHGFETIGGMQNVKDFFHRNVIKPIREGNLRRVPLGILLPGPPGTGKTILAGAAAKESGLNCAALNLSKIFNQYVGASERNLDKALACLDSLAPCLVIIDEIDQSGLNRENSGDSGVSNRLFKRLLEYMSDPKHRGRVVFVGLTNRPDLMDAALKRPGRFDRKVPILPPDERERADIFKVMFTKYKIDFDADLDISQAAKKTNSYTGAEIEALVLKALEISEDAGSNKVAAQHLEQALKAYIPTTGDIQSQVRLALAECNDRDLVPPQWLHLFGDRGKTVQAPTPKARSIRSL